VAHSRNSSKAVLRVSAAVPAIGEVSGARDLRVGRILAGEQILYGAATHHPDPEQDGRNEEAERDEQQRHGSSIVRRGAVPRFSSLAAIP
jgi:hypothetical protein